MVNSLDYHSCSSRLASRIHPFMFLYTLYVCLSRLSVCLSVCVYLCLSVCLSISVCLAACLPACLPAWLPACLSVSLYDSCWIFSQTFIFHHRWEKFMEFTFPIHSKLAPKSLPLRPRQKNITHSPRQHSFENLFPRQKKMVEETVICLIKFRQKIWRWLRSLGFLYIIKYGINLISSPLQPW